MKQVEQWFSLLQRKRLRLADFADKADLTAKIPAFIAQHNEHAHPFNWSVDGHRSTQNFDRIGRDTRCVP